MSVHVRVQAEPLDLAGLLAFVQAPSLGGVAVFLGTVRDHHAGRAVVRLEYEAYQEMAEAEMRKIAEEGRVAVRNVRRDTVQHLKDLKEVGSDDERRAEDRVQKLTDDHTKTIDDLLRHKEAEIMEV